MLLFVFWNRVLVVLKPFLSQGGTFTFTGVCALDRAVDNFAGAEQLLLLSLASEYKQNHNSIMLLAVFWK